MSNWSFTGQPDVPAWPKDEAGREVQAVLLTHTFDAPADADPSGKRLRDVEVQLDQCWDLLRQRRARREFGRNPDDADVRDAGTVEGYTG